MELWLVDISTDVVSAWRREFAGIAKVHIRHDDILNVAENTIVSPANSYGYMDGGIDLNYRDYFGSIVETRVQDRIRSRPGGLPVGAAVLVETNDSRIPFLISAPTMVLPEAVPPSNCFYAMAAILQTAEWHADKVKQVFCPGLGTGMGRVAPDLAAREMASAYRKWAAKGV